MGAKRLAYSERLKIKFKKKRAAISSAYKRFNKLHKPVEDTIIHLEGAKLLTTATEPAALSPERSGLFGCFLPYGTISSTDSENPASVFVPFWTYISSFYSIIKRLNMESYIHTMKLSDRGIIFIK